MVKEMILRPLIFIPLFLILISSAFGQTVYYPDPVKTPGAVLTQDAKVICKVGYTKTVRSVPSRIAKQVFKNYGIDYSRHSEYEVDHLISLELGGSNDITNLWPQKYCKPAEKKICWGAREKDVVETNLHRRICKGQITISGAQKIIVSDWYAEYRRIKGEQP